jgi:hypothetical protein
MPFVQLNQRHPYPYWDDLPEADEMDDKRLFCLNSAQWLNSLDKGVVRIDFIGAVFHMVYFRFIHRDIWCLKKDQILWKKIHIIQSIKKII